MAINRVTIMGNLTRDAELRKKGDAASVLTFGLAIKLGLKDGEICTDPARALERRHATERRAA